MEDSATKLRLQWRDHGNELSKLSREIFGNDDLTDVTLTCRGGSPYHAHKMVLAAASTYFRNFFKEIQCKMPQHQVIFMKDVEPAELEYLLQFIYLGEVDIPSTDLERLITISRELGIVGLNTVKNEDEETVERSIPKVAKRKYAPTPKPPPMKQQPQEAPTHKKLKVKMDPEPIYEEEEQEQEEDEESQDFIDAYMDGDGGEDNDDEAEDVDNVEDANEKEEVIKSDYVESVEDAYSHNKHRKRKARRTKERRHLNNSPMEGSIATPMQGSMGRRSTLYIIGDYLYCNGVLQSNKVKTRCRNSRQCRRYAYLEPETLRVIKFTGEHICIKDTDLKYQIQMESEMKELAESSVQGSKASFRKIYTSVCMKNPTVASRITFSRMYKAMDNRWRLANASTM